MHMGNKYQCRDVQDANLFQKMMYSEKKDRLQDQFDMNVEAMEKDFSAM